MKTNKGLYVVASFFIVCAIACGMIKGSFVYKSSDHKILIEIQSQDVEIVSAVLSFISVLLGVVPSHNDSRR
ncbi:hypothetical protein [Microseira sp. BLCC-F43]|uniref:hypothetical protein n=1 Tax=Microseira sp. BLCC-F43 TaxID=3153602 RepID=UPI0035BB05D3